MIRATTSMVTTSNLSRDGDFNEGQESYRPGVEYKINASTMPHLLIRKADGNFWFGSAGGQTVTGIGEVQSWGERTCGDYDTAPDPSFIGNTINDVFIYKNRLGFLADENVIRRTRGFSTSGRRPSPRSWTPT